VDKGRIGIWGWSFGGYMTIMSMSEGTPVFKAGVLCIFCTVLEVNIIICHTVYKEQVTMQVVCTAEC